MTDLEHFLVLLHSVPGIRDRTIYKILKYLYFEGISPTKFLEFDENTYRKKIGLSKVSSVALGNNLVNLLDETKKLVAEMRDRGFNVISIFDDRYPSRLKIYMNSPPPILYVLGNIKLFDANLLALFNSRDTEKTCINQSLHLANKFKRTLITGLYGKNYSYREYINSGIVAISDRGVLQISKKKLQIADLIIAFSGLNDMGTPTSMINRDRIIMALATTIIGVCIRHGGNMMKLLKRAKELEKEIFVLENEFSGNIELQKLGVKPLKI